MTTYQRIVIMLLRAILDQLVLNKHAVKVQELNQKIDKMLRGE